MVLRCQSMIWKLKKDFKHSKQEVAELKDHSHGTSGGTDPRVDKIIAIWHREKTYQILLNKILL